MKITYLLGAGASRNALPIVEEIPDRLEKLIELLKTNDESFFNDEWTHFRFRNSKKQLHGFMIQDFEWLLAESKNHSSIDTFAKKLYIKGDYENLRRLKVIVSIFFVLEQNNVPYDKRYDTFYASILLDSLNSFPENIRILSWNYDYQFERAFAEYSDKMELSANQDYLNVITKYSYRRPKTNQFSILKLNGTSNFIDDKKRSHYEFCSSFDNCISRKLINEVLCNYALILHSDSKLYCGLSFAWETNILNEIDIIEKSIQETNNTEILIIIGYSFPFFNRDIDRKLINKMGNLKKVYFQSPQADIIKERFLSIRSDIDNKFLLSRFDVGQFLLPNEL